MQYVMLIYQGDALERQAALPEEEQKQVYADYQAINETPGVTPGLPMALPRNATTVLVEGGKTRATDGPVVGTKEAVGGWFILEADDLDAASRLAARSHAARFGGASGYGSPPRCGGSRRSPRRPRQDSNLRPRLRRPVLYPLSYGGSNAEV